MRPPLLGIATCALCGEQLEERLSDSGDRVYACLAADHAAQPVDIVAEAVEHEVTQAIAERIGVRPDTEPRAVVDIIGIVLDRLDVLPTDAGHELTYIWA